MQWVQAHPKQFLFAENLGKISENPGKNGTKFCRKTYEDLFGDHPKKGLGDLCGRKYVGKSFTKNFSGKFRDIR